MSEDSNPFRQEGQAETIECESTIKHRRKKTKKCEQAPQETKAVHKRGKAKQEKN